MFAGFGLLPGSVEWWAVFKVSEQEHSHAKKLV